MCTSLFADVSLNIGTSLRSSAPAVLQSSGAFGGEMPEVTVSTHSNYPATSYKALATTSNVAPLCGSVITSDHFVFSGNAFTVQDKYLRAVTAIQTVK